MSLFKKNKNKNKNEEVEVSEQTSEEKNSGVFSTAEFDKLFSAATDDVISATAEFSALDASLTDIHGGSYTDSMDTGTNAVKSDMEFSEDELNSILDKYIDEDDPFKDALNITAASVETVSAKPGNVISDDAAAEDASALEGLTSDVFKGATEDKVTKDEKKELSADEAIEEFMKNVSMGGSITKLLENSGSGEDDGIEIPVFAGENADESESSMESADERDVVPVAPVTDGYDDFEPTPDTDNVGTTDMNLRIAFGLEEDDEAEEEVNDAVKKMGDHFESDKRVHKKYVPEHSEFTDPTQAKDIALEFRVAKRNTGLRLVFALIAALALLVYENVPTITGFFMDTPKQFAGIFDPAVYPVVYMMGSLQILFICALFALPELKHGLKRLFTGSPTPESITVFSLVISALATLLSAYFITSAEVPHTYNAVAAVSVVGTLIYSYLNVKRAIATFFIAGGKKKKYAMNRIPDNEALLSPDEYEDDMYGDVMRVERTGFIDGFFSRMGVPDGMTTAFSAGLIGVAAAVAILFGIFGTTGGTVASVINLVYVVILAVLPLSVHLAFSYPFYCVSKIAYDCDSAIIGETSLEEYASAAVVSFDDGNVFPSFGVKIQNIRIYNKARIDRVLYYASSTFRHAGGPLADVFEVATMEMEHSNKVQLTEADKGFLSASVDGVNIIFGSYPALIERGLDIPDAVAMDDVDLSDELSIMYMFREDVLIAKLYIKYVLDGDIEPIIGQFQDYGMYLCVRTYDPNIDEDMICAKLQIKNPPVKVVRYRTSDATRGMTERMDSGLVTCGSPKLLLQLLPYCDKTIHTKRTCGAISIISVIFSLMVLAIAAMSGNVGDMSFINSLYMTMYHGLLMLLTFIATKIFIR